MPDSHWAASVLFTSTDMRGHLQVFLTLKSCEWSYLPSKFSLFQDKIISVTLGRRSGTTFGHLFIPLFLIPPVFLLTKCVVLSRLEKAGNMRSLGGSAVGHLPWAQGVILESQDQVPHQVPCVEPASPSACVSLPLSLFLCLS